MTSAERAQVQINDETYRRVLAACVTVPSLDRQEHAAKITLAVHRARFMSTRRLRDGSR